MGFLVAFITLFAAIDVIAVLPIYHGLTRELAPAERQRVLRQSVLTALVVSIGFALAGRAVLRLLGVEVFDFKVAGGLLLLIFSIQDLVARDKPRRVPSGSSLLGVVPLGMPLIVGPAVLTTILILLEQNGYRVTLAALSLNLSLVWLALALAPRLLGVLGEAGARVTGKLASLLLAAIGVRMMRIGFFEMLEALRVVPVKGP